MKYLLALIAVIPLATTAAESIGVSQTPGTSQTMLLQAVPPEQRIIVPAAGKTLAQLVVFVDTNCPYCLQLHNLSASITRRGIEVQYIFYPRSGPAADSYAQAIAVWCSGDRLAALDEVLRGGTLPVANCDHPVLAHYELALQLELKGTPAIITPDGVIAYGVPDRPVP